MDKEKIKQLLTSVKDGSVDIDEALTQLKALPYEDLGFAVLDSHRSLRKGYPEVIFCEGKTIDQIISIIETHSSHHNSILATRADPAVFEAVSKNRNDVYYNELGRVMVIGEKTKPKSDKEILVLTAGTADIPVAEEAAVTAESTGNRIDRIFDVGVAGIHRLFHNIKKLQKANVIVVAAGMDGALPSIIGGLVDVPVIAVPTSVGYGSSFEGLAALLTMLNSCAPGIAVVNIDNGFGAGYLASIINQNEG